MFANFEKLIRFHPHAFIVYKNEENLKILIEMFCQKRIVSNVLLALLENFLRPRYSAPSPFSKSLDPPLDWHVFMGQSLEILNVFNVVTLKQIFEVTLKKLEYCFLLDITKTENALFPCITALSKAIVKTNRMGSTKCIYHKEQFFASNYETFVSV